MKRDLKKIDFVQKTKKVTEMSIEDFKKLPFRSKNINLSDIGSIVILPTDEMHDSGFMCMDFVAVDVNLYPICRLSGCSDALHLDGIGGYGKPKDGFRFMNDSIIPKGWSIDCLPCGLLRVFSRYKLDVNDIALSSFEIFSEVQDESTSDT